MAELPRTWALALVIAFAGCGECDVSVGEVTVGGQKVHEDLSVPRSFSLDSSYARKHGYDLPATVRFESPRGQLEEHTPPKEEGIFLRLNYFDEAGRASEDFLITSFRAAAAPAERMAAVEAVVRNDALPVAMSGGGEVIGTRELQISGMPAIAGAGKIEDDQLGTVFTGVFAIPLPDSERGIAIVSHHIAGRSSVKTPDDIGKKGVLATVLESMKIEAP